MIVMEMDFVLIHNVCVLLDILENHVRLKHVKKIVMEKENALMDCANVTKVMEEKCVRLLLVN